jgi:hypothetical protein
MIDTKIEVQIVTPAMLPIKCPVCNGFTTVSYEKRPCPACKAQGYILVPAKEEK